MPFVRLLVTNGDSMEMLLSTLLEDTDTRIIQKKLLLLGKFWPFRNLNGQIIIEFYLIGS